MSYLFLLLPFFFFKQKTAYEMRISDWISDVCSSDLLMTALPAREIIPMVRPFDLNQHLEALQLLLDAQTGDGAQVVIRDSAAKPLVRFDASALDAALVELVANARTALATGGRIIVRAKRAGRRLWVTVADTGKGMSQQDGKEEHTSELQSLMRISYAVFCLHKINILNNTNLNE